MSAFNIKNITNLNELAEAIEMGYIDNDIAFKIDKFSRSDLANGVLSLGSSFNNLNPFLSAPTQLYLCSTSVSDTQLIKINYIDLNYVSKSMTYQLNGTTPVVIFNDAHAVWRMENIGSVDLVGTITVGSNATGIPTPSQTYCNIVSTSGVHSNQSLTCVYTVPDGWTGFITHFRTAAQKNVDCLSAGFLRDFGSVFKYKKALSVFQSSTEVSKIFLKTPSKSDLKIVCIAQTGGICYFEYTIILIKNEYLNRFLRN